MRLRTLLSGLLVVMMAPLGLGGAERLSMQVSPSVAFAPADLVVRTTVEADTRNRAIAITAESDDFYRSSVVPLDGEHAPRTSQFRFRSLPGGVYTVIAVLKDANDEPIAQARREIKVVAVNER